MMLNVDLTNRCNLRCPICFANSDAVGYLCELPRAQVHQIIQNSLDQSVCRGPCIQFSGGEPTTHPEFLDIIRDTREFGYAQIQIASNGVRLAREPDFARACADAGLNQVYLQFDGLSDEVYQKSRGRPLLELKLQAIENIYNAGMRTTLVPTIVKGFNDDQVGPILQFALENVDKMSAISWQPVAFTGRIDYTERMNQRYTLADLARGIDEQTGMIKMFRDWYPYSFVEPFCRMVETVTEEPVAHTSCHGHCGMATYLIINPKTKQVVPIPEMLDVEGLMSHIDRVTDRIEKRPWLKNRWHMALAMRRMRKYFNPAKAPEGFDFTSLVNFMDDFANFGERFPDNNARREQSDNQPWRALLMAAMHFQDTYNYEIDRVRRCVVHYGTPDGKLYPFCTYNCGPCYRTTVENQFSRPLTSC
jgi:hypothetical protein